MMAGGGPFPPPIRVESGKARLPMQCHQHSPAALPRTTAFPTLLIFGIVMKLRVLRWRMGCFQAFRSSSKRLENDGKACPRRMRTSSVSSFRLPAISPMQPMTCFGSISYKTSR